MKRVQAFVLLFGILAGLVAMASPTYGDASPNATAWSLTTLNFNNPANTTWTQSTEVFSTTFEAAPAVLGTAYRGAGVCTNQEIFATDTQSAGGFYYAVISVENQTSGTCADRYRLVLTNGT